MNETPYSIGYRHGSTPGHPYEPDMAWSYEDRVRYAQGFDAGIDSWLDREEQEAA